jgi:hypothetical protein
MLYGPEALLLPRYLRHRSYVILSNVFDMDACISPRFLTQIRLGRAMGIALLRIHILGCGSVDDGRLVWLVG